MITSTQSLRDFVKSYESDGVLLRTFPTKDGNRYAIRICLAEEEGKTGYSVVAANTSKLEIRNRPTGAKARKERQTLWDNILHTKEGSKYIVCTCVIDDESINNYGAKPESKGSVYYMVSLPNTAEADSPADFLEKAEVVTAD